MHTVEMSALFASDAEDAPGTTLVSGATKPPLGRIPTAVMVALGGGIGAILRWVLTLIEPTTATPTLIEIPWATLAVNVLGCLGLGALHGSLEVRDTQHRWLPPLLGPGFMGGFTTMSTLVMEGSAMIGAHFPTLALFYALGTLLLCLISTGLGILAGHSISRALLTYDRLRGGWSIGRPHLEIDGADVKNVEAENPWLTEEEKQ